MNGRRHLLPDSHPEMNKGYVDVLAQVDPCDSREDPVVCAALIEAAVFIDLGDVFETEQDFWKVPPDSDRSKRRIAISDR